MTHCERDDASLGWCCSVPWHRVALRAQVIPWRPVPPARHKRNTCCVYTTKVNTDVAVLDSPISLHLSHSPQRLRELISYCKMSDYNVTITHTQANKYQIYRSQFTHPHLCIWRSQPGWNTPFCVSESTQSWEGNTSAWVCYGIWYDACCRTLEAIDGKE